MLKSLQLSEKERLRKIAEARHTYDSAKRQQMMAVEHEQMNIEFKRKQTYHNLVKKNMHDFTRRAKNQILLERSEKMQRLKELNDEMFREMDEATLDTTPKENRRRTTI